MRTIDCVMTIDDENRALGTLDNATTQDCRRARERPSGRWGFSWLGDRPLRLRRHEWNVDNAAKPIHK
jgi:hypothetical protein